MAYRQPHFDDRRDVSPIEANNGSNPDFPPPPPVHRNLPAGIHPDSAFARIQNQQNQQNQRQYGLQNSPSNYSDYSPPGVTPGSDNLGENAAGGGINGIAIGVAHANERESGAQPLRDVNGWGRSDGNIAGDPRTPLADNHAYNNHAYDHRPIGSQRPIYSQSQISGSSYPLAAAAIPPAGMYSNNNSTASLSTPLQGSHPYQDSPYNRYSSSNLDLAPAMGEINPNDVADDDDWGMGPQPPQSSQGKRRSFAPFSRDGTPGVAAGAAGVAGAAGLAAGGATAAAATAAGSGDANGQYNAVPASSNTSQPEFTQEKSAWLASQNKGRKRLTWIVSIGIALIVIGAILGGVLGAVLPKNGRGSSSSSADEGQSADSVKADNKDDLSINSDEIKALMNNKDLHKVFPGMDYTPLNAQYPDCMHVPPSQNNITRDIAVMSQLTNAVRLYGTDCNQTEMVLHAIDRLELKDMKVWLGVWLGNNHTTNERQVSQMWSIIDTYGEDKFKGIIVGNEVLYRQDLTEAQLVGNITDIRQNISDHNMNLKIATSDLGDNWTAEMAKEVDIVMSNVHPFFAGVKADVATSWTWTFWQEHDVVLTAGDTSIQQIIAEVGWPTGGGNNCGGSTCASKTDGSVAGIDELNTFMEDWVCPSLRNGTEYFWFSAFDEPWKILYNEKGKEWEDKWGLMDVNRNLKPGVTIPDCDGQTVSSS